MPDAGNFQSGLFDVGKSNVVAWEHMGYTDCGCTQAWICWAGCRARSHCGIPGAAQSRRLNTPDEFDIKAALCLIGSEVVLEIGRESVTGTVSAVARVPAAGVQEVSEHVMDLVPYLAENYPKSGFGELEEGGLVLNFCGRQLSTEAANMKADYYAQTRIIVGITP